MSDTDSTIHPHVPREHLHAARCPLLPGEPNAADMSARILLAEDNALLAKLVGLALAKEGYDVAVVHDGKAAIETLVNEPIDLAILDVDLPERSGFEVCRFLRNQPHLQRVPAIICTGRYQSDDQARARELRTYAFFYKPFAMAELVQCIRAALAAPH